MLTISFDTNGKLTFSDGTDRKRNIRDQKGKSLIDFLDSYVVIDIETTGLEII